MVDAGDELVCQSCGIVGDKEVVETGKPRTPVAIDFTGQALGGYMGSIEVSYRDRFSRGFAHSASRYEYLKVVSDYAGREESSVYACARMIERVCEKLGLPRFVLPQALRIAKRILAAGTRERRVTLAAVSAYALIAACKAEGVTSASVKDVVSTFQAQGRRVKASSIIQLSLESPMKTEARGPEDYVGRVVAKLSSNQDLAKALTSEGIPPTPYFSALREGARDILESLGWDVKVGRSPCALAATAVYGAELLLAEREGRPRRITQREVALCGDTAEYTVREQYKEIFVRSPVRLRERAEGTLPLPRAR
jgi:transcription initiation factor TFIIIB Brf1 subunit/transcription initiation factor TFIIB